LPRPPAARAPPPRRAGRPRRPSPLSRPPDARRCATTPARGYGRTRGPRPSAALARQPRTARRVLHQPAEPLDVRAQLVGAAPVAPCARVRALGDEPLDRRWRPARLDAAPQEAEHAPQPQQLTDTRPEVGERLER